MSEARRFPIQVGRYGQGKTSVLWSDLAPYEGQFQVNHSQTMERLAERGGLSLAEVWAVVNGLSLFERGDGKRHEREDWEGKGRQWVADCRRRAEEANSELAKVKADLAASRKEAAEFWLKADQATEALYGKVWSKAVADICIERAEQDRKWGADRDLPGGQWLAIMTEEVGEVATECISFRHPDRLRAELVQVAAVAVAWIENIDRKGQTGQQDVAADLRRRIAELEEQLAVAQR